MSPLIFIIFAFAGASSQSTQDTIETTTPYVYKPPKWGGCSMPDPPPNTRFEPKDPPYVEPGQAFDKLALTVVCDTGYGFKNGLNTTNEFCERGMWSWWWFTRRVCERYCKIPQDENMEYRCLLKPLPPRCFRYMTGGTIATVPCPIREGEDKGYRPCKEYEPPETMVQPVCLNGNSTQLLYNMTCIGGEWDIQPTCDGSSSGLNVVVSQLINTLVSLFKMQEKSSK